MSILGPIEFLLFNRRISLEKKLEKMKSEINDRIKKYCPKEDLKAILEEANRIEEEINSIQKKIESL